MDEPECEISVNTVFQFLMTIQGIIVKFGNQKPKSKNNLDSAINMQSSLITRRKCNYILGAKIKDYKATYKCILE